LYPLKFLISLFRFLTYVEIYLFYSIKKSAFILLQDYYFQSLN